MRSKSVPDRDLPVQPRSRLSPSAPMLVFLGVLLAGGMILWTKQFIRVTTHDGTAGESSKSADSPQHPGTIDTDVQFNIGGGNPRRPFYGVQSDRHQDGLQSTDPLVRSAEVVAIESNPFGIDQVRHEPGTRTEDAPAATSRPEVTMSITGRRSSNRTSLNEGMRQRIVLQSTIVGEKRRAALINNKLFREGTVFRVDGRAYRLQQVFRGYVVLEHNGRLIDVKLSR